MLFLKTKLQLRSSPARTVVLLFSRVQMLVWEMHAPIVRIQKNFMVKVRSFPSELFLTLRSSQCEPAFATFECFEIRSLNCKFDHSFSIDSSLMSLQMIRPILINFRQYALKTISLKPLIHFFSLMLEKFWIKTKKQVQLGTFLFEYAEKCEQSG